MKYKIAIILIIALGAFLRFHKLNWGDSLFTHPDEYHIVSSVNQLSFPNQLNPHFFNYGTVTIYLIYFTKLLITSVLQTDINVFLLSRFLSALFSTLTLIFIYQISRKILDTRYSLLATCLAATTPGLIQQAHFATPESIMIFFMLGTIYFLLEFLEKSNIYKLIITGIFLGLALGVKVSSIILLLPVITVLLTKYFYQPLKLLTFSLITLTLILFTLFITNPFIYIDFTHFKSSILYEGSLATGSQVVFYTRQFINTQPLIFQLTKIYPYALGPALLITSLIGLILFIYFSIKQRSLTKIIFLISFLIILITNAFLFTKWTRFMAPTFPLLVILSGFFFFKLSQIKLPRLLYISCFLSLVLLHLVWSLSFFHIYLVPDVRVSASGWLIKNLPSGSIVLVEGGNTVDLPLSGNYQKVSFDFYTLDENTDSINQLIKSVNQSDYFIIESRRVFMNYSDPKLYPKLSNFYQLMFNNEYQENLLGYTNIMEWESYPKFTIYNLQFTIQDEQAEETWSVFDHPVIRVYKNLHTKTLQDYEKLLSN